MRKKEWSALDVRGPASKSAHDGLFAPPSSPGMAALVFATVPRNEFGEICQIYKFFRSFFLFS